MGKTRVSYHDVDREYPRQNFTLSRFSTSASQDFLALEITKASLLPLRTGESKDPGGRFNDTRLASGESDA